MGDELFTVAVLLRSDPALRRFATDASLPAEAKQGLAEELLGSQIGDDSLDDRRPMPSRIAGPPSATCPTRSSG